MALHNFNIKKAMNRAALLMLPVAGVVGSMSSCTDDHFDINADVNGKQTIWQNIQTNENLSEFADILKNVNYSKTEDKTTSETYADLFNGDQTFTVWAPVNGSFNYSYYKQLLATGIRDSIYKVETELIRNNMARFTYVINKSDSAKIELYNEKTAFINYDKCTFKGVKMTQPNIGTSNGVLHITEKPAPYQPNLYEYMATRTDLSKLNEFIKSFQTREFSEGLSTQGPTVNGQITWVDSITRVTNSYITNYMGALLNREDSNYVMVMPTNEAWEKNYEKTLKYFNIKDLYKQDVHTQTENGKDTILSGVEVVFSEAEIDSLKNYHASNAIAQNLAFNANWQYENVPIGTYDEISRVDSLKSTAGTKFKKTGTMDVANRQNDNCIEMDKFTDLFGSNKPVETSNGLAYITDSWNYPYKIFAPDFDLSARVWYESCENSCDPKRSSVSIKANIYNEEGEAVGDTIMTYPILDMKNSAGNSMPVASFQLNKVRSCKYDIYVVLVYNFNSDQPNKFKVSIINDNLKKSNVTTALKNPVEDAVDFSGTSLYNTTFFANREPRFSKNAEGNYFIDYTDTICVAKDYEFPVSYYGVPTVYPTMKIQCYFKAAEKLTYSREILVNSIILKSKEW